MLSNEADVLVVGAGVAGLTCALALADAGLHVLVLERSAEIGGRARSWRTASGLVVDIGPHVLASEYRNFLRLLERLGTARHVLWHPDPCLRLVLPERVHELRHRALPPPLSLVPDLLRMPGLGWRDHLASARVAFAALRLGDAPAAERLDALDARTWLRGLGVTESIEAWFRMQVMVLLNTPLERCSAAALVRLHWMLLAHRRFHFGIPTVGLSDLYANPAERELERKACRVMRGPDVVHVRGLEEHVEVVIEGGEIFKGRYGVDTRPDPQAEPSPYVSLYLAFDRALPAAAFWGLPWTPDRLNWDFYDLSRVRPELAGGPSVITSNVIHAVEPREWSDERLVAATIREIALLAPAVREARLVEAHVHRIPMAVPMPLVGAESKRRPMRTGRPRVFLAGDGTRTGLPASMESAAASGYRAAEAVLQADGRPAVLALPPRRAEGLARFLS